MSLLAVDPPAPDEPRPGLPASLTSFIGREREVATACQLLRHPEIRLLTLTGLGGVGKTRLAIQAAANLAADFADGVIFVPLDALTDPELVILALARTLEVQEEGKQPLLDRLKVLLRDKQQLLLLDNFEQVITAAPRVVELLAACPQVKFLVTSREPLRVSGEHEFAVPLLALPDLQRLTRLKTGLADSLAHNPAINLFVDRAKAVKPDFRLTDENTLAIVQICALLDGLPLAIELAAARSRFLSPPALLARLQGSAGRLSLQLLTAGARDAPARQQTLTNTIQWSYDLLELGERQLFRQLSIFAGGFTLAAAEAIIEGWRQLQPGQTAVEKPLSVLEGVASLLDKSLLQPASSEAEPYFTMLVALREFAAGQLEPDEAGRLQQAYLTYYLNLAETVAPQLLGPEQKNGLDRLELEHDNLRAALRLALAEGKAEIALCLSIALARFWLLRGYLSEGNHWLEACLALPAPSPSLRAKALSSAGLLALYRSDFRRAGLYYQESLALFQQAADKPGIVTGLQGLAQLAMRSGQFDTARSLREECLVLSRELGDQWGIAQSSFYLGLINWMQGHYAAARPLMEEGLACYRQVGDPQGTALALQGLGWVALSLGETAVARTLLEECLVLYQATRDWAGIARASVGLGRVALEQKDYVRARTLLVESIMSLIELGDKYQAAGALGMLAALAMTLGQPATTVQICSYTETMMSGIGAAKPAFFRLDMERHLATARARLGEAAFAAAWVEGQVRALDQLLTWPDSSLAPAGTTPTYPAGLTEREVAVLRLLAQGLTNAQIAQQLIVSPFTINAHLRTIYNKLDVTSRAAATRYALEHHLV